MVRLLTVAGSSVMSSHSFRHVHMHSGDSSNMSRMTATKSSMNCNLVQLSSCCIAGTCYDGECEGLHQSSEERKQQAQWPAPQQQQTIITAGWFASLPIQKALA